jgi:hypothetical protein
MDTLSCSDLVSTGVVPEDTECCESCHEDYERLGIEMCHPPLPDGRRVHVCCAVARWLYLQRDGLV